MPKADETSRCKTVDFMQKTLYLKIRLVLGLITLLIGLWAANLALFQWVERVGLHYLFGEYARYVCAYGGFSAIVFGSMLVNDYLVHTKVSKRKAKLAIIVAPERQPLPEIKKAERKQRITNKGHGNIRKTIAGISLTILFLVSCPMVAYSVVSYTATVGIIVKFMPIYYLHRIDLSGVGPAGKLMNTTQPPPSQSEILYELLRGGTVYFYSPMLSQGSIPSGTWFLYLWASTASAGKVSRLTVQIHVVSSDGSVEKAVIGSVTNVVVDYGYSERVIEIAGSYANISSTDRIRLTLHAQAGAENDPKGLSFYYDGYGTYQTLYHETRLEPP